MNLVGSFRLQIIENSGLTNLDSEINLSFYHTRTSEVGLLQGYLILWLDGAIKDPGSFRFSALPS